jgi:hypothetical protein
MSPGWGDRMLVRELPLPPLRGCLVRDARFPRAHALGYRLPPHPGLKDRFIPHRGIPLRMTVLAGARIPGQTPERQSGRRRGMAAHRASRPFIIRHSALSIQPKLVSSVPTTRCHPSASTKSRTLNGSEIRTGGSISIPIDTSMEAITMSITRNGR